MASRKSNSQEQKRRIERLERKKIILRGFETPSIRIESTLASRSFVEVVNSVVANLDLFDEKYFPNYFRDFFRNLKLLGLQTALERAIPEMRKAIEEHARKNHSPLVTVTLDPNERLTNGLGNFIVDRIVEINEDLFPINDVEVLFIGKEIVLALSSMLTRNIGEKEFFHSRKRLQIEVDSKKFVLAFNDHSIKAICNRFRPDVLSYGGLAEAHALFSSLNYAEVVRLPEGNLAVSIFDFCLGPGTWQYDNYVGRCLPGVPPRGPEIWHDTGKPYGYRTGYFPIDLIGEYAVTRTLLPPGFAKTPERQLLKAKCKDPMERYRLTRIAQNMSFDTLRRGKGFDAVEWFHKNGIPQVIDPPIPLFDDDYRKRKYGLT